MLPSRFTLLTVGAVLAALGAGCRSTDSGSAASGFVEGCADSDLNSRSVLYFGPSNQIGPGSIWSRLGANGGYQPQWRMQDLGVDAATIDQGKTFSCNLTRSSRLATAAELSVVSSVSNVSADAKADFSRGKVVDVSSTGAAWDTVVAGPYGVKLRGLSDPAIRSDIAGANRIIMRRALRLEGYRVTMAFDSSVAPQIRAKYGGKILGRETVGDVGADLSARWTSDDKLELTAAKGVYVAGEFAQLVNGEWVGTRGGPGIGDLQDTWVQPYSPKR